MLELGQIMHSGPPFSREEYLRRQSALLAQFDPSTILLVPTNPSMRRSHDVNFPFRASSNILYLTGWSEPDALFAAWHDAGKWVTALFVRDNDEAAERWEGRRAGVQGALENWPVDHAFAYPTRIETIRTILEKRTTVALIQGFDPVLDDLVIGLIAERNRDKTVTGRGPSTLTDPNNKLAELRLRKSDSEIQMMQKSASIASEAHQLAMKETSGATSESKIQSIVEAVFTSNNSQCSYGSIVAGGDNATILHYHSNSEDIEYGDLVLIDAGCEVNGYASDITRTWPVSGKFSNSQKEIYHIVLKAQEAAISKCRAGNSWSDPHRAAMEVISNGLIDLGILNCSFEDAMGEDLNGEARQFFMHGTSHSLGLDVHDVGITRPNGEGPGRNLESGMVLTVEPGLYFPLWTDDGGAPERYRGIGIRIEDDVLITEDEPFVLTASCPKTVEDIEAIIGSGV